MDHQQQSEVRIVSAQVLAQLQNAGYQVPKNKSHFIKSSKYQNKVKYKCTFKDFLVCVL